MNTITKEKMKKFAPSVVRIGISLVFIWFGTQQLMNADAWAGLIPQSVLSLSGLSAATFVYINGILEVVLSLALLTGFFTRTAALLLSLHLFSIVFIVGYNDVGVRDFGLAVAAFSIFLNGCDGWCVDELFE